MICITEVFSYTYTFVQVDSSPLQFIETQDEMEGVTSQQLIVPDSALSHGHKTSETTLSTSHIEIAQDLPSPRPQGTPESPTYRKESRTTLTPRLRHDNSQIVFAAIESSPYDLEALELQFLTDRQREVKERQQREAAVMFPDLRSSPRPKSRGAEHELPKLYQKYDGHARDEAGIEDMGSPVLPPAEVMMDTFLGSSPTPKSRRFSKLQLDGPPSSPPTSIRDTNLRQGLEISVRPSSFVSQPLDIVGNQHMSTASSKEAVQEIDVTAPIKVSGEDELALPTPNSPDIFTKSVIVESAIGTAAEEERGVVNEHFLSDMDIFVDAPSSPRSLSLAHQDTAHQDPSSTNAESHGPKEITDQNATTTFNHPPIESSNSESCRTECFTADHGTSEAICDDTVIVSVSSTSSCEGVFSDQDEQISAQIAMDMEKALSQVQEVSRESSVSINPNENGTMKRKRVSGPPSRSTKKSKLRSPLQKVQVVVERRAPPEIDEEIYDCIVVAPRFNKETQTVPAEANKQRQTTPDSILSITAETLSKGRKRSLSEIGPTSVNSFDQKPSRPSKKRKSDNFKPFEASVDSTLSPSKNNRRGQPTKLRQGSNSINTSPVRNPEHSLPTSTRSVPGSEMASRGVEVGGTTKTEAVPYAISRNTRSGSSSVSSEDGSTQHSPSREPGMSRAIRAERRGRRVPHRSLQQNDGISKSKVSRDPGAIDLNPPSVGEPIQHACPSPMIATNAMTAVANIAINTDGVQGDDRGEAVTGGSMLERLRFMIRDAQRVVLGPEEGMDIISAWMELGRDLHAAHSRSVR